MLLLKILVLFNLHIVLGENCSSATSCSHCMSLDDACYWCAALATEKSIPGCLRFNVDTIANLLCPGKWTHSNSNGKCSIYENADTINLVKSALLNSMNYKNKLSDISNNYFNSDYESQSVEKDTSNPIQLFRSEAKGTDLKNLLHKLLILKLLRKIKNKDTVLTEEEKDLIYRLSQKSKLPTEPVTMATTTTTTTSTTTTATAPTIDFAKNIDPELLKMLRSEAERRLHAANAEEQLELEHLVSNSDIKYVENLPANKVKNKINTVKATVEHMLQEEEKATPFPTKLIPSSKSINLSLVTGELKTENNKIFTAVKPTRTGIVAGHNHVEMVGIKYEDKNEESLEELAKQKKKHEYLNFSIKTTSQTTRQGTVNTFKSTPSENELAYCKLFEENDLCNSDHNCTWCNTLDTCIQRNKDSYKTCVKNVEKMVDDEYGLDRCFKSKHCKQCVQDDKCYWCDVSQRCHTYPFFGYVPNSCGGDWYVKQCDVQLAVIIVVLPLIIILLGMVTFYFCLKYCHYRQKVLRVPLFEKPGIFDYRKDKKVYFVNPEDESSDDELAKEKMRKKYRIPIEKEPLIDPNT